MKFTTKTLKNLFNKWQLEKVKLDIMCFVVSFSLVLSSVIQFLCYFIRLSRRDLWDGSGVF